MHPGDTSLGASQGNVLGCRCSAQYELKEGTSREEPDEAEPVRRPTPTRRKPKPRKPDNNLSPMAKTKPILKPAPKQPKNGIRIKEPEPKTPTSKLGRLTAKEKSYIDWYSGDGFRELNDYTRNPGAYADSATKVKSLNNFASNMHSAINKRVVNKDLTTFRGVNSDKVKKVFNTKGIIGKKIDINSFQSTTLSENAANAHSGFGGVKMRINVKKGTNAIDLFSEKLSRENLSEIVLPNRGSYLVNSVTRDSIGRTIVDVDYIQ